MPEESSLPSATAEETDIEAVLDLDALNEEVNIFADAFVVTGTKEKRRSIDSPFTVFTLDRQQIEALCPTDIGDLLKAIPGFDTFKTKDGVFNASEPGYATEFGSQYLVLIDGVSFGNKRGRAADWATIPVQLDEIERLEYLPGAQSTLYGSYAAVGVLNIITRRVSPETWDKDKPSSLRLRVGPDGLGLYDLTHHLEEDQLTTTVWGSFRDIDNHDNSVNYGPLAYADQGESTYRRGGFSIKNDFDKHKNLRLDFSYLTGNRDLYMPMVTTSAREDLQEVSTVATYSEDYGDKNTFTLVLKNRNNKSIAPAGSNSSGDFADSQIEARKQFTDSGNRIISLGAYYQEITAYGELYGYEDANLYESSVNALVEQPLKDNQSIFIGVNGYHSSYTSTDLSYKVSYNKKTRKDEVWRLGYGNSVRGPDVFFSKMADVFIPVPDPNPPFYTLERLAGGNPYLENEEFVFSELSYEKRTRNASLQSRLSIGKSENRIVVRDNGDPPIPYGSVLFYPQEYANEEGNTRQIALTSTWDRNFSSKWRSTLTWRYLRAKNSNDSTSYYSPKHSINLMAAYTPTSKLAFTLFSKTYTSYNTSDGTSISDGVGGYTKIDLAAKFKTTSDDSQSLWIRLNNITDKKNVESYGLAAGATSPGWEIGRQFTAGYSFKF
jgi:outer membrane cobalamin receptor